MNYIRIGGSLLKGRYTSLLLVILVIIYQMMFPHIVAASPLIHRIAGDTQYDTASDIAKEGWTQSDYAVLAYGGNFPDALAAGPLAKKYNAPILLTEAQRLSTITKQTLSDLKVKNVIIVGGTAVISSNVENEIKDLGINVTRLAGQDRYDTAIEIAKKMGDIQEVVVVSGEDYGDALSVSPIAAEKNIPIILVPNDSLTSSIQNYISSVTIAHTYFIGSDSQINDSVLSQFPNVERITGNDNYTRNVAVIQRFESQLDLSDVVLATGNGFADALAGSAYAALKKAPVLLVDNVYNQTTTDYLTSKRGKIDQLDVLGGEAVMPSTLVGQYVDSLSISDSSSAYTASEIAKKLSPSIVNIEAYDSSGMPLANGSGYIIDTTGKIVTNYHLINNADSAKVKTNDGKTYDVIKVLAYDSKQDLALIKVNATGLQPVMLGDSDGIGTGDKIYTIGNSTGDDDTMSDGIISTKSEVVGGESFIQISAPIAKGTSGGVLVNEQGEVIGTTTDGIADGQTLYLAIPTNLLKPMITQDINKTLAQLPHASSETGVTNLTDEDFSNSLNYLNSTTNLKDLDNAYSVMTISGKSVHFIWKVNDYQSGTAEMSIHGIMDPKDYGNWISLIKANEKGNIMAYFAQLNNDIIKNYPGKSFSGNVLYQDYYPYYASPQFPANEVTFSGDGKWLVKHTIVSFYDLYASSTSDPRVNVLDDADTTN